MSRCMRFVALCVLIAAALIPSACSKRLQNSVGLLNQPPTIQMEAPIVSNGGGESITARVHWTATDIDGRVDHYLVTRDLAALSGESGWTTSAERERTLSFRRATSTALASTQPSHGGFELLAVRAVDDQGATSQAAVLVLFGDNVAPTVRILTPRPSALLNPSVPPTVWITWQGSDPDGPNGRPAKYKYRLFRQDSQTPWQAWLANPDSLRRQFAPTFAGWDSIHGDSTRLRLTNLDIGYQYLFAITALDAEGAYDPVFSMDKNVLVMSVVPLGSRCPNLTLFNSSFFYSYASGGIPPVIDSSWVIRIQAPAGQPLTVNWYAKPAEGTSVAGYRWALDISDITDVTPRHNRNDLARWSAWNFSATSVTLGPFHGPELDVPHRLYVEATDDVGQASLGIVEFRLVRSAFDRDLLIVNDTRFQVDELSPWQPPGRTDSLRAPFGAWPSRAELDTFLFAVGGVRWRMTPAGCLSPQGIFKGYRFDTLGTRRGSRDPTIPLDVLGHYQHIVWMTDKSDLYNLAPNSQTLPMATLTYMSAAGRQNTLATWVEQPGERLQPDANLFVVRHAARPGLRPLHVRPRPLAQRVQGPRAGLLQDRPGAVPAGRSRRDAVLHGRAGDPEGQATRHGSDLAKPPTHRVLRRQPPLQHLRFLRRVPEQAQRGHRRLEPGAVVRAGRLGARHAHGRHRRPPAVAGRESRRGPHRQPGDDVLPWPGLRPGRLQRVRLLDLVAR